MQKKCLVFTLIRLPRKSDEDDQGNLDTAVALYSPEYLLEVYFI